MFYSVLFLGIGFSILMFVISVIDSTAKKIPVPEFEVYFENQTKTIQIKRKQRTQLIICLRNKGEDMAEDITMFCHFPPQFNVLEGKYYWIEKQMNVKGTDFPDYVSATFDEDLIHVETVAIHNIAIVAPDEQKTYEIPLYIYERKIGLTKDKLTIQVID
jgi:hypothetical protein